MLTVGSLFSGIGGFDLGFERAGMRTVWFCEQDKFCQRVLAKHWPGVPVYPDVRALVADTTSGGAAAAEQRRQLRVAEPACEGGTLPVPVPYVDVLCGGFPCQDISVAGRGEGIDGQRSGLWAEYARLIRELRPRYVVVENVAALLHRGLDRVLRDLAACGYDAEWDCVPASALGAPHRRDRVWLVAYPSRPRRREDAGGSSGDESSHEGWATENHHVVAGHGQGDRPRPMGDADAVGRDGWAGEHRPAGWREPTDSGWWLAEPDVGRVAHGVPARVDRLRALGNALIPQIAELIGRRIVEYEEQAMKAAA